MSMHIINGNHSQTVQNQAKPKQYTLQLDQIINQLQKVSQAYINVFRNDSFKSDVLTRKHAAYLYTKVNTFFNEGSTQIRNQKKQQLCYLFRHFVAQFVGQFIGQAISQCQNDWQFVNVMIQKWNQFKSYCYFYQFLLKNADNHYQTSYKTYKNQAKSNKIQSPNGIFPISAIAIHYYQILIFRPNIQPISRIVRQMLGQQRENKIVQRDVLRSLFQIIYSSGLSQLARLASITRQKGQNYIQFYPTKSKQIEKQYCSAIRNTDANFFRNILASAIQDCQHFYRHIYSTVIVNLGPHEDFTTVKQIIDKQQDISENYLFNHRQKSAYIGRITQIIIGTDLQTRLKRQYGFKYCLQKFNYESNQYQSEIKLYLDVVFRTKDQNLKKILFGVLHQFIIQAGKRINQKMNKRRQHMTEIVALKKSVNRLVDQFMHKDLNASIVKDKSFKQILDSIEVSKNLADFVDFKVKQCIKNKYGDAQILQKTKDIFIVLQSLAAVDSFLAYHQQLLGRRLLQSLNEPRLDIQKLILRKIADQLGSVTISAHSYMIKDIQRSQQITQNYSKKMLLARFKWSCRIISPQFWSDNINNNSIQMVLPEILRLEADTIRQLYNQQFGKFLVWRVQKGFSLFQGVYKSGKYRFQSQNIFMMLLFHISEGRNSQMCFFQLMQKILKLKQGGQKYIMKCLRTLIQNGLIQRSGQNEQNFCDAEQILINPNYNPGPNHKPNQTIIIKASAEMVRMMHETSVQNAKILKQRQRVIEAVLVKLLKNSHSTGSNKITLQQLCKGVRQYNFLKNFQIPQSIIKQRLQEIISRGYCQRDQKDRKIYHYVA